ncbi:hypothetical protein [Streptomonospora sp. PA3]|uniref:hypothetical protein n=1 Tax=Streptomonospora sp. PA3 TaxID=2607326 RepID=UPI0012DCE473|nr:hypothetical protein [Streptomonospora sp. PA3]
MEFSQVTRPVPGRHYVREYGLGGLMMWNLDMDPSGELVRAMAVGLGAEMGARA